MLWTVVVATLFAGLAMPLGASIARFERIGVDWLEQEFRHSVIAFGGGALLSAVALVLVPEGIEHLSPLMACFYFLLGALSFMGLDILLYKLDTPASQLAAMLSDFIPESIALGAAFAIGSSSGLVLALLIALQNIPEGFSAYRELSSKPAFRANKLIMIFCMMALFGPMAGAAGYYWLATRPEILSAIMLFAAGGILYSIFQDLAPQVKLEKHWAPPMGAVLGFMLGMLGFMLTA